MKKVLKVIGIILLVIVALVAVLIYWITHIDSSVKDNYRESIETGGTIEAAYLEDGPYATSYYEQTAVQVFEKYEISYPTELETEDKTYPVIVVCNGTGWKGSLSKAQYQFYASYGFIVIATEETYSWNAFGAEMCIRYLELLNEYIDDEGNPSIFYQKIDFDNVGIIGHSQGGVGVMNAITNTDHKDIYKAAVALSPTNYELAVACQWPYDATQIDIPILLMSGAGGGDDWVVTLEGLTEIYDMIPGNKVMARRCDTAHGLTGVSEDGYVVTWFMWQLQSDEEAAKAFVGEDAELLSNELYQDVQIDID
ncbi:MAG: hypothetical protein LUF30_11315 [Lachnospiraceae bacterium]|nr:hypothetical protein [Lachnospiraceae bacterium]